MTVVLAGLLAVTGCTQDDERAGDTVDPETAANEVVAAVAAGRGAVGGEWLGGWDLATRSCADGGDQFAGYFEQQPARDPDESEPAVRAVLDPYGGEVTRTDRPDGSVELLLSRADGFLTLVTITEAKTSFTATSACFPEGSDADPREYLPQSEQGVTVL